MKGDDSVTQIPMYLPLPKEGTMCQVTGLTRGVLRALAGTHVPKINLGNRVFIHAPSLIKYLESQMCRNN